MLRQAKIAYAILLYSLFSTGFYLASYGVLIPYYSRTSGLDQTHYSFLFIIRSVAYTTGSIAVKYLNQRYSTQNLYLVYFTVISISLFICSLSINSLNLASMLFISGVCFIQANILSFSVTIKLFKDNRPQFWVIVLGTVFGAGATLAPLIAMWFQLHTYKVMAVLTSIAIPLLLWHPLPSVQQRTQNKQPQKTISRKSQLFIGLIMLLFPMQEIGLASWLPTYAIKAGISDTSGAAIYSLYFWLPNWISRIIWAFLINASVTKNMRVILSTLVVTSFLLVILQFFQLYFLVCIVGAMVFGAMTSCQFAYCMSLPIDNGFESTPSNLANFALANCIGEGLLLAPLGYSMQVFGFESLVVVVLVCCLFSYWSFNEAVNSMMADKKANKSKDEPLLDCNQLRQLK